MQAVKDYFTLNDKDHIREAAVNQGYPIGKTWFIQATEWSLSHNEKFFARQEFWSDKEYFVVKPGLNESFHRSSHPATLTPSLNTKHKTKRGQRAGLDCSLERKWGHAGWKAP